MIIIGGGVAGLSTAMQLAGRGASVHRSGTRAARQRLHRPGRRACSASLRGNAEHTRMLIDGVAIVKELEQLAGVEIFVQTGSLRIAETPERAAEIASLVEMGKSIGFDIDHMPIDEVARRMPYMRTDDLVDACYCPTDGHLQPAELVERVHQSRQGARRSVQNEHAGDRNSDRRRPGARRANGGRRVSCAGRRQRRRAVVVSQRRAGRDGAADGRHRALLSHDAARSGASGRSAQPGGARSRTTASTRGPRAAA